MSRHHGVTDEPQGWQPVLGMSDVPKLPWHPPGHGGLSQRSPPDREARKSGDGRDMDSKTANELCEAISQSKMGNLVNSLLAAAVRYAHYRAEWALVSIDERKQMDAARTQAHNAFIDACNILSRNMANEGEDIAWRERLGNDRQVIGDFACHLHCILGIRAR